ncbi:hypothetical protein Afil01_27040 [Actinorhabdospora filicis]|uniref:Uncharacterized protein n=1 Tax=Actinorhabdospora filicis TaxID=1785913 RepID=A0A9W6SLB7_9ACTN|nr:hypothetical protein [Actinorhabdospora filicis]GLZ77897.1 hypothetical protein Afil01_27040 [Actinorhabdospora filicis]
MRGRAGNRGDGGARPAVHDYTKVDVTFRPGTFAGYDEARLARQLARLGLTTWVAYHRGRSQAYQKSKGLTDAELAEAERPTTDPKRRAYERELNAIEGLGVSPGRAVRIRARGLMEWTVDVLPGSVAKGEEAFLAELHGAIVALLADRRNKIIVLKSKYFDLGIPRKWLEVMAELQARAAARKWAPGTRPGPTNQTFFW